MNFISYAQNFEDVMLWRALHHVVSGFYIDIGAQDPVVDSVSLAFYENGWRGVHVEPTRQYAEKIQRARPEEVVRQVAIGDAPGALLLHEFPKTGLSTSDAAIAQRHIAAGHFMEKTEVQVVTLASVLNEFRDRPIHWLKIDVEGMEASVLRGWEGSDVRPWVLVLESTRPSSQEENHVDWEHLVLEKNYEFAYFDGLNRFYVHKTHGELMSSFRAPPNVFDGFFLSGTSTHPFYERVQKEERKIAQEERELADAAAAKTKTAETALTEREFQIQEIYSSVSWRITRPLRLIKRAMRSPKKALVDSVQKVRASFDGSSRVNLPRSLKSLGHKAIRKVLSYPKIRHLAIRATSRFPALDARLRIQAARAMRAASEQTAATAVDLNMPTDSRRIFNELKRAINRAGL